MGRLGCFTVGVVCGAGLLYGAFHYHVVRAAESTHVVAKLNPGLKHTYVDIREFGFEDWNRHRDLARALLQADKGDLLTESVTSELRDLLPTWRRNLWKSGDTAP